MGLMLWGKSVALVGDICEKRTLAGKMVHVQIWVMKELAR